MDASLGGARGKALWDGAAWITRADKLRLHGMQLEGDRVPEVSLAITVPVPLTLLRRSATHIAIGILPWLLLAGGMQSAAPA